MSGIRLPVCRGKTVIRVRGCRTRPAYRLSFAGGRPSLMVAVDSHPTNSLACAPGAPLCQKHWLKYIRPATVRASAIALIAWTTTWSHPSDAPLGHGKIH